MLQACVFIDISVLKKKFCQLGLVFDWNIKAWDVRCDSQALIWVFKYIHLMCVAGEVAFTAYIKRWISLCGDKNNTAKQACLLFLFAKEPKYLFYGLPGLIANSLTSKFIAEKNLSLENCLAFAQFQCKKCSTVCKCSLFFLDSNSLLVWSLTVFLASLLTKGQLCCGLKGITQLETCHHSFDSYATSLAINKQRLTADICWQWP